MFISIHFAPSIYHKSLRPDISKHYKDLVCYDGAGTTETAGTGESVIMSKLANSLCPSLHSFSLQIANDLPNHIDELGIRLLIKP